jgi:hypothetical protein
MKDLGKTSPTGAGADNYSNRVSLETSCTPELGSPARSVLSLLSTGPAVSSFIAWDDCFFGSRIEGTSVTDYRDSAELTPIPFPSHHRPPSGL